ncbi:hypothetical protein B7767_07720 [Streptomyces sp. 13-12-16]|nr:hypothetical protein B7767_07720 [Streptomyces sp. 13-12-16]
MPQEVFDGILPIDATARRFRTALPEADYVEVDRRTPGRRWKRTSTTGENPGRRSVNHSAAHGRW